MRFVKRVGYSLGEYNKLIHGDNLVAMRELMKEYEGKITLVYIDPPYLDGGAVYRVSKDVTTTFGLFGSGEGEIAYAGWKDFVGFLRFMRERLVLLKRLMSEKGTIYVHVDQYIDHYIRVMLDGLFGRERFINSVILDIGVTRKSEQRRFKTKTQRILVYSKSEDYVWNEPKEAGELKLTDYRYEDENGRYRLESLWMIGKSKNREFEWKGLKPPNGYHWFVSQEILDKLYAEGRIVIKGDRAYVKSYVKLKNTSEIWRFGLPQGTRYPTQKNLEMLKMIVQVSSNRDDLVLDAFCGSGTTLVAAAVCGRRWIGIDESKIAIETTMQRLNEVGACYELFCL